MVAVELAPQFGYVILVNFVVAPVMLFIGLGGLVMKQRAAAKKHGDFLAYPAMTAPDLSGLDMTKADNKEKKKLADQFTGAQRGHYNAIENFGGFLTASLLAGLHYPIATAVLGAGWILGAYTYASNYTYKGAKTRYDGAGKLVRLCFFALLLLNIELAFSLILETPLLAAYLL